MFGAAGENLGRRFVIADLVPAAIVWAVLIALASLGWFFSPQDLVFADAGVERLGGKTVVLPSVIFITAVLINQLNRIFTRIVEGYSTHRLGVFGTLTTTVGTIACFVWGVQSTIPPWLEVVTLFGALCAGLWVGQRLRLQRFLQQYDDLERRWKAEPGIDERFLLEHELAYLFPRDSGRVLPTRFGNIYRAAEYYPRYMFNIDAITMWPRLLAVIPSDYSKTLDDSEASVAFAVNMCMVLVVLSLCCSYAGFRAGLAAGPWVAALICALGAAGCYQLACAAVAGWSNCIRSAFDLFRIDLLEKLRIEWPDNRITNDIECELWRKVGRIVFYNHRPDKPEDFVIERGGGPNRTKS